HRDFHYGDETILAELARVEGDALRVGEQVYRVVVVPPVPTLRRATVELLARFAAAGGRIIALGTGPSSIDGRPAPGLVLPAGAVRGGDAVDGGAATGEPVGLS